MPIFASQLPGQPHNWFPNKSNYHSTTINAYYSIITHILSSVHPWGWFHLCKKVCSGGVRELNRFANNKFVGSQSARQRINVHQQTNINLTWYESIRHSNQFNLPLEKWATPNKPFHSKNGCSSLTRFRPSLIAVKPMSIRVQLLRDMVHKTHWALISPTLLCESRMKQDPVKLLVALPNSRNHSKVTAFIAKSFVEKYLCLVLIYRQEFGHSIPFHLHSKWGLLQFWCNTTETLQM